MDAKILPGTWVAIGVFWALLADVATGSTVDAAPCCRSPEAILQPRSATTVANNPACSAFVEAAWPWIAEFVFVLEPWICLPLKLYHDRNSPDLVVSCLLTLISVSASLYISYTYRYSVTAALNFEPGDNTNSSSNHGRILAIYSCLTPQRLIIQFSGPLESALPSAD